MRFDWDDRKAAANLAKHDVSFNEAGTVLGDSLSWTYPDAKHSRSEQRWITIGLSESSRVLVVSHTDEDEKVTRIISARQATRKERRFHEEG
ncbi:MAG: BrnT family toxin [bacterium]|nr:BrnT family toxin [bacterium]